MNKAQLRQLIAENRLDEAIQALLALTQETHLYQKLLLLSARFNEYKSQQIKGVESDDDLEIRRNKITNALLAVVEQLPENTTPPDDVTPPPLKPPVSPDTDDGGELLRSGTGDGSSGSLKTSVWIGILSLAAILTTILFVPCPTSAQFFVFRLILSLGAAGIGSILPGFLNFESAGAKAGGALALFALVYLLNPAELVGDERCNQQPFTLTISVQMQKPSSAYPDLKDAELWLWNRNDWMKSPISPEGVADFKNISPDMTGFRVPVQLKVSFYRLAADSLTIQPPSAVVVAVPDGSLEQVSGSVQDAQGQFLADVIVRVEGIADTTDAFGIFQLSIPAERQIEKYRLIATKTGYDPWEYFFSPTAGQEAPIVLTESKK